MKVLIGCGNLIDFTAFTRLGKREEKWKILHFYRRLHHLITSLLLFTENEQQYYNHTIIDDVLIIFYSAGRKTDSLHLGDWQFSNKLESVIVTAVYRLSM